MLRSSAVALHLFIQPCAARPVEMVAILVNLTVVVLLMAGLAAYAEFTRRGVKKA